MPARERVFVLLIGNKERGDVNHFQLLQEETAVSEGRRLDLDVEVAFAPGFDQLRTLKRRIIDATTTPLDAVVTEPANTATMDMILNELKGKLGLVILSAWGPSIELAASSWGQGLPIGGVGTDHAKVGEIQGRQVKALLPEGGRILYIAGPPRSSAAQQRLEGLKSQLTVNILVEEIAAGQWTESDGIVAFNDWYRVAKARNPRGGRGRGRQRRAGARGAPRLRGALERRSTATPCSRRSSWASTPAPASVRS